MAINMKIPIASKVLPSLAMVETRYAQYPRWMRLDWLRFAPVARVCLHRLLKKLWLKRPGAKRKVPSRKIVVIDGCFIAHPAFIEEVFASIDQWPDDLGGAL